MTEDTKQKIRNGLNAAVSAAAGGAALAVCESITDPTHADLKHLWPIMLSGAVFGLAQHYRQQPLIRTQQALTLSSTPAGQVAMAENAVVGAVAATVQAEATKVTEEATGPPKGE